MERSRCPLARPQFLPSLRERESVGVRLQCRPDANPMLLGCAPTPNEWRSAVGRARAHGAEVVYQLVTVVMNHDEGSHGCYTDEI